MGSGFRRYQANPRRSAQPHLRYSAQLIRIGQVYVLDDSVENQDRDLKLGLPVVDAPKPDGHRMPFSTPMAIAIFFTTWFVVLFAVLPFGVRSQDEAGDIVPGTDPGAPVAPRLFGRRS
jgi:hypothetical protein